MKKILVAVALGFLMSGTIFAEGGEGRKAQNSGGVSIKPVNGSKQAVVQLNPFRETVVIRVMDAEENTVYKEVYSSKGVYRKLYDFSVLEAGEYVLNIRTKDEEYTRSIYLQDAYLIADQIAIDKSEKPIIHFNNNELLVAYNNSDNEKVVVSFSDYAGDIIFESKGNNEPVFQKKYDLNRLKNGTYQVNITAGANNYSDYLEVK